MRVIATLVRSTQSIRINNDRPHIDDSTLRKKNETKKIEEEGSNHHHDTGQNGIEKAVEKRPRVVTFIDSSIYTTVATSKLVIDCHTARSV